MLYMKNKYLYKAQNFKGEKFLQKDYMIQQGTKSSLNNFFHFQNQPIQQTGLKMQNLDENSLDGQSWVDKCIEFNFTLSSAQPPLPAPSFPSNPQISLPQRLIRPKSPPKIAFFEQLEQEKRELPSLENDDFEQKQIIEEEVDELIDACYFGEKAIPVKRHWSTLDGYFRQKNDLSFDNSSDFGKNRDDLKKERVKRASDVSTEADEMSPASSAGHDFPFWEMAMD